MLTLALQLVNAALLLALGGSATRVGWQGEPLQDRRAAAWLLTGVSFLLMGGIKALQNVWGTWAFVAGPASSVYLSYLRWAPGANHSRSLVALTFGVLLTGLAARGWGGERFWMATPPALVLGAALGAWLGWQEGELQGAVHYTAVSVLASLEMIVLLAALLAALSTSALDRLLWLCLGVYALADAISVVWFSALAWVEVDGAWSPSPWHGQLYHLAVYGVMLWLALRRLALAREQSPVPAPLEPLAPPRVLG